jgi:hypothetical protein
MLVDRRLKGCLLSVYKLTVFWHCSKIIESGGVLRFSPEVKRGLPLGTNVTN